MMVQSRFAARAALLSALAYVLALASMYIPNVSLSFIVIFASGALFGLKTGLTVGGMGMFLWTVFNPMGMASVPITLAQIISMMLVGALGATVEGRPILRRMTASGFALFGVLGLTCGLVFQIILNGVSAWLYGPFREAFVAGLSFSLLTIISNAIIFPACYPLVVRLASRGQGA